MAKLAEVKKAKRTDLFRVDPRSIQVQEGFNVRKDMGDLDELMNSIVEIGLQQPLIVKKERGSETYLLIDGERRYRAIRRAIENGHDIPYVNVTLFTGNEEDMVFTMITTGIGQKQFTNLEQAEAFKRLVKFGYDAKEIAKKVGKSLPHIYNLLRVADAPKVIKNHIQDGTISTGAYVQIAREVKDSAEQIKMVETAIKDAAKSTETEVGEIPEAPKKVKVKGENLKKLKHKSFAQKLRELSREAKDIDTPTAKAFVAIIEKAKDGSVEDLIELLK